MLFNTHSSVLSSSRYSQRSGSNGQTIDTPKRSKKLSIFMSKLASKLQRLVCFLAVLLRPLRDADWLSYAAESAKHGSFKLNALALPAHA